MCFCYNYRNVSVKNHFLAVSPSGTSVTVCINGGKEMKKRSVGGIIVINFFKTIGIIALLIAVGVLSYYLTMLYFKQTARTERSTAYKHVISVNTGNESSNLIYSYDAKTKKIKAMVLELFDSTSGNLNYITIPVNTQIAISSGTYAELIQVSQKLPQLSMMSDINEYFSGDVAYEYGILILQEELKADIGYFTAVSSDKFDTWFENAGTKEKPKYKPARALLDRVAKDPAEDTIEALMEELWNDLITDITLSQKQNYAEALTRVNPDNIRLYRAYGTKNGNIFTLNKKKNKKLVNRIWESESYTSSQKSSSTGKTVASQTAGHSIQITNGSAINGLAAAYQKKLQADGYHVIDIGNLVGNKQTKTVIYARKKTWADGFEKYFPDVSVIQRDTLTNGADIEIVLGTDADLAS